MIKKWFGKWQDFKYFDLFCIKSQLSYNKQFKLIYKH